MKKMTRKAPVPSRRSDTRARILDAAVEIMRRVGLVRATTREIAQAAGYSEAALYKYFADKDDIFFCVLTERLPTFAGALMQIAGRAGERPLQEQLADVAAAALRFYSESMPIAVSLLAEPEALARNRARMVASGRGPEKANESLAAYLRAEQQLGRISRRVNVEVGAALLIGACFQHVFLLTYHGEKLEPNAIRRTALEIAKTLLDGLRDRARSRV
jgi:AcrR family transcriptional regulator